ncbi:MAG: NAD(P)H-dependent oxidoreductase [Candidatus Bathyarchaeota archaeon]|jgi:multimeric flavodoxin WrbA|nr:NAD(P)H-dependent oxidoreductase [Candidatus Bathyarchaeota archaeon]MCW3992832.1 NAD(P)H-dependent oxidoreductase [Candidatus Bathyarchaeota archaeon]
MVEVFVLYYTRGGRTKAMADAIAAGAEGEGATAKVKRVDYATATDFIDCDAVAFGSPNYFSYMAGLMKDFFDRNLGVRERVTGKPAAAFTSGGGSSDNALQSLERMISSFRLEKAAEGVVSSGEPTKADLDKCKDVGAALAKAAKERAAEPLE